MRIDCLISSIIGYPSKTNTIRFGNSTKKQLDHMRTYENGTSSKRRRHCGARQPATHGSRSRFLPQKRRGTWRRASRNAKGSFDVCPRNVVLAHMREHNSVCCSLFHSLPVLDPLLIIRRAMHSRISRRKRKHVADTNAVESQCASSPRHPNGRLSLSCLLKNTNNTNNTPLLRSFQIVSTRLFRGMAAWRYPFCHRSSISNA